MKRNFGNTSWLNVWCWWLGEQTIRWTSSYRFYVNSSNHKLIFLSIASVRKHSNNFSAREHNNKYEKEFHNMKKSEEEEKKRKRSEYTLTIKFIRLVMCDDDDDCLFESKLNDLNYCLFGMRVQVYTYMCVCAYEPKITPNELFIFFMVIHRRTNTYSVGRKKNLTHTHAHTPHLPSIIKPCKQVLEHGLSSFCNRISFTLQLEKKRRKQKQTRMERRKKAKYYMNTCE